MHSTKFICKFCNYPTYKIEQPSYAFPLKQKYLCQYCNVKYYADLAQDIRFVELVPANYNNKYTVLACLDQNKSFIINESIHEIILTVPTNDVSPDNVNEKFKLWLTFM